MLAHKVDFSNGIETALYLTEGESQCIEWGKGSLGGNTPNDPRHLCCRNCHHNHIAIKLDEGGEPSTFCYFCDTFVKTSWVSPRGPSVTATRNAGRSKPPIDQNIKIGRPRELTRQANDWLHWGHGAMYKSDRSESNIKLKDICFGVILDITKNHADKINRCERLFGAELTQKCYTIICKTIELSRCGEKLTASAIAKSVQKERELLSGSYPAGALMDLVVSKIARYDDEIMGAYRLE